MAEGTVSKLVLVAVGGNALIRGGQTGTAQEQFENAVETAAAVVRLIRAGYRVVLTHGNGPQVGAQLIRSESAASDAYRLPLDCCVASTQGEIGYVLQYAMWQRMQAEGLKTPVVFLVTQFSSIRAIPPFRIRQNPLALPIPRRCFALLGNLADHGRRPQARIPQSGAFTGTDCHY